MDPNVAIKIPVNIVLARMYWFVVGVVKQTQTASRIITKFTIRLIRVNVVLRNTRCCIIYTFEPLTCSLLLNK